VAETDVVGEAQADAVLDGGPAVHVEDEAVEAASQANAYDSRNPAHKRVEGLFEEVATEAGCLAVEVEV
jgi:cobalamin biosynthesis Mg chelatase CobN